MDNIPMFGARKNGREPMNFPHPLLEGLLKETYGIFVYQEQVMQAAQVLAGYTLGQADLLRRAMGKKIKAEMDAQRAGFVAGCGERGIGTAKANELFDLIDKFAGYGFNKSHAAAYALLSYQTAWLKAHHPVEFYAASMAFDLTSTDKLAIFVDDARRMGVEMRPPCINASGADFLVEDNAVRYALGALKGVGERAMNDLAVARTAGGRFASLDDFAARVDPRLLNRRQLESLAAAGAFDGIMADRAAVFAGAEIILAHAASAADGRASGQSALFGDSHAGVASIRLPKTEHWSLAARMTAEREAFGFYFSAHPVDRYSQLARAHGARPLAEQSVPSDGSRSTAKMAAMVEEARWRTSAKGRRYLLATLSDTSGQFVASVFDEDAAKSVEAAARNGDCMLLSVELDRRPGEETPRVTIRSLIPLDRLTANARLTLHAEARDEAAARAFATRLRASRGGRGTVHLSVRAADGSLVPLMLGRDFLLDAELVAEVERIDGVGQVALAAETSLLALAS
jgi:DNA polymerase-3 subunit alpha